MSAPDAVILLHGLARSPRPMEKLARAARAAGFLPFNRGYPSRSGSVQALVDVHLAPQVREALATGASRVHFIGHSMGGILVRQYLAHYELPQAGRVVMIGTPNRGSELVDRLGWMAPFGWINGPAGNELGTGPDSLPNRLPPATYEAGIIAGTRSYNPAYSAMIEGANDGKVSVERSKLEGMRDMLVLPVNHTFMMQDAEVVRQAIVFLEQGRFDR